jgi:hypothetical protein
MRKQKSRILTAVFLLLFVLFAASHAFAAEQSSPEATADTFFISGIVVDSHKEPVREAEVKVLINGQPHNLIVEHKEVEATETSSHGTYQLEFDVPPGTVDTAKIQLLLSKTSYRRTYIDFTKEDFAQKGLNLYAVKNQEMPRAIGPAFWIATVVFLIAYALISFELLHRTIAAMIGAAIMLLLTYTLGTLNPEYHIISFERAMHAIDMNVIFLLMGMMIIVGVLKHTGVFQWCAYMSIKIARGNVMALAVISMIFIATTSAFLDM